MAGLFGLQESARERASRNRYSDFLEAQSRGPSAGRFEAERGQAQAFGTALAQQAAGQGYTSQAAAARLGNEQATQAASQFAFQAQQADLAQQQAAEEALFAEAIRRQQEQQQARQQALQFGGQVIGAAGSMGSGMGGMFSDERTKEDIRTPAKDALDRFYGALEAKSYTYRPEYGGGDRLGVMAQDLEKSEVGRTMVFEDSETGMKKVDIGAAVSTLLASGADANKRLRALEGE